MEVTALTRPSTNTLTLITHPRGRFSMWQAYLGEMYLHDWESQKAMSFKTITNCEAQYIHDEDQMHFIWPKRGSLFSSVSIVTLTILGWEKLVWSVVRLKVLNSYFWVIMSASLFLVIMQQISSQSAGVKNQEYMHSLVQPCCAAEIFCLLLSDVIFPTLSITSALISMSEGSRGGNMG